MYTSYYHLREMPFTINTDTHFLWLGEKHREALAILRYGLLAEDGFVVLTGDVGTGKTTLVNALIEQLDDHIVLAHVNHPTLTVPEFIDVLCGTFKLPKHPDNKSEFLILLRHYLEDLRAQGSAALLIIDEAHRLSEELLEEIRLLSNMERKGATLLNVFLIGQDEFSVTLASPRFRALNQRITLFYAIHPLDKTEIREYISHRLKVAGSPEPLFNGAAIRSIYGFTQGNPRLINILCNRALLTGFGKDRKHIDAAIISECIAEMGYLNSTSSLSAAVSPGPARSETVRSADSGAEAARDTGNGQETVGGNRRQGRTGSLAGSFLSRFPRPASFRIRPGLAAGLAGLIALIAAGIMGNYFIGVPKNDASIATHDRPGAPEEAIPAVSDRSRSSESEVVPAAVHLETDSTAEGENAPSSFARAVVDPAVQPQSGVVEPDPHPLLDNSAAETGVSDSSVLKEAEDEASPPRPSESSLLDRALAFLQEGDYAAAVSVLETNPSKPPDSSPRFRKIYARALVDQAEQIAAQSPAEAENLLKKAVQSDSTYSRPHFVLGKLYTSSNRYDQAISSYLQVTESTPASADPYFNLGFLYARTGDYVTAEKMFLKVVELKPGYMDKALFNLAVIQNQLGKREQSVAHLREAIRINPDNRKAGTYLERLEENGEYQ